MGSEIANHEDLLAERLNAQPAIFKGCSSSELGLLVGGAAAFWLPVSLLAAGLGGAITVGFGLAGIGVVGSTIVGAAVFQKIKRNRPEGFYQQRLRIRLQRLGLLRAPWVLRSGLWDLGRRDRGPLPFGDR